MTENKRVIVSLWQQLICTIFSIVCLVFTFFFFCYRQTDEVKHFKLRKVGPNDGRKVTEIKIVPKVRTQLHYVSCALYNIVL